MSSNVIRVKKDSVSINICVGDDLFFMLEMFCAITGQSKTIAVERAIEAYCKNNDSATCDTVDQIETCDTVDQIETCDTVDQIED